MIGKRKKMLQDMQPSLLAELRQELSREGLASSEGVEFLERTLLELFVGEGGPLTHPVEWYNSDDQLQAALEKMLAYKRELGTGGYTRAKILAQLDPKERARLGFKGGITGYAPEKLRALRDLESADGKTRLAAIQLLSSSFSVADVSQYAYFIGSLLQDRHAGVRKGALVTLRKLACAPVSAKRALSKQVAAIMARATDSDEDVRRAAKETLEHFHLHAPTLMREALAEHASTFGSLLAEREPSDRGAALAAMRHFHERDLAQFIPQITDCLKHDNTVRVALVTLRYLRSDVFLEGAASAVAALVESATDTFVVMAALELLEARPEALARHTKALTARLVEEAQSRTGSVPLLLRILGSRLVPADTLPLHMILSNTLLDHSDPSVRVAVAAMLRRQSLASIAAHRTAIIGLLSDDNEAVRVEAMTILKRMPQGTLVDSISILQLLSILKSTPSASADVYSALHKFGKEELAKHMPTLLPMLNSKLGRVRQAALGVFGMLHPRVAAEHFVEIVARVRDEHEKVREKAVEVLDGIQSAFVGRDASNRLIDSPVIELKAQPASIHSWYDDDPSMYHAPVSYRPRDSPSKVIADTVAVRLDHADWNVREQALQLMGKLEPLALVPHVGAICRYRLTDEDCAVRAAALVALGALAAAEPAALAKHSHLIERVQTSDDDAENRESARALLTMLTTPMAANAAESAERVATKVGAAAKETAARNVQLLANRESVLLATLGEPQAAKVAAVMVEEEPAVEEEEPVGVEEEPSGTIAEGPGIILTHHLIALEERVASIERMAEDEEEAMEDAHESNSDLELELREWAATRICAAARGRRDRVERSVWEWAATRISAAARGRRERAPVQFRV